MGIEENELRPLVDDWRNANHKITRFWADIERAAIATVETGVARVVRGITFTLNENHLTILLPSGRPLYYPQVELQPNKWGHPSITFMGVGASRKYQRLTTYGGKLVENITQAVARDLLAHALTTVTTAGHTIVMHIHDEIVIETPHNTPITTVCDLMSNTPPWAKGLPITADGYECNYYKKD